MCQTKLPGVCMGVEEMKVRRSITRATLLLLAESNGKRNDGECNNEQLAIVNNLRSFSAFYDECNAFQLLRESISETYNKHKYGDHDKLPFRTVHFPDLPNCPGEEILARTYVMSKVVKMNECGASACEQRRRALEKAAPRCGWPGLEALVVTTLACWLPSVIHLVLDTLLHMAPEAGTVFLRKERHSGRSIRKGLFASNDHGCQSSAPIHVRRLCGRGGLVSMGIPYRLWRKLERSLAAFRR